jgi:NADH-quinone oxidoreductase subunit C
MADEPKPGEPAAKPEVPAVPKPEGAPATPAAKPAAPKPAAPKPVAARPKPKPKAPPEAPKGPSDPLPPDDLERPAFLAALEAAVPGAVIQVSYWVGDWTVIVHVASLIEVATHLKESDEASFDYCADVTASDWPAREQRFDLIYCLYSIRRRHRVRVKVRAAEDEPVPSVTGVWPAANWLEREVWDMFGVNITGHPDLRRILMPDGWQGHPQRKDYPLEGPGELLLESPMEWLRLRNLQDETGIE